MKKSTIIAIAAALLVAPVLAWQTRASASSFRTGETVTVAAGETVHSSVYAAGNKIQIDGSIDGDLFCAGSTVVIEGNVHGDVLCAAQSITINGYVAGDIRVAAQEIDLQGTVGGSASAAAQNIIAHAGSTIGRDAQLAAGDITVDGTLGRDLVASAATLHIGSMITRDISAQTQQLTLGATAQVGGNISYASDKDLTRANTAQVRGTISKNAPHQSRWAFDKKAVFALGLGTYAYMLAALSIVSLSLLLLFPRQFKQAAERASTHTKRTLLAGVLAHIAIPILIILGFVSALGVPLAIFGMIVWSAMLFLSGPLFAQWLGYHLGDSKRQHPRRSMLLGSFVVLTCYFIPFVSICMFTAVGIFGVGMATEEIRARLGSKPKAYPAKATSAKKD